ncbi:MAG: response regulator [Clostridiales bacterium]|jgi:two-component system response regulator YesN|nr:response regulator [Clostridiales bacterium]
MYKMIIADDEWVIRKYLTECFDWARLGVEIIGCCMNGNKAMDYMIESAPDLIITDIKMPGISGLELIEKICAMDSLVEIIVISGFKEFQYAQQAMRYGVTDYILKPICDEQLIEAVSRAIARLNHKKQVQRIMQNIMGEASLDEPGLISKVKAVVIENISNPNLTLRWIADKILFVNVDYLSRRFVKETGERFSDFLTRVRMEKAKSSLQKSADKSYIAELAAGIGFGGNVKYFSKLFKTYTGLTPTRFFIEHRKNGEDTNVDI